jgi:hypothetical protein
VATSLLAIVLHAGAARGDQGPAPPITGAPPAGEESGQSDNAESEQLSVGRQAGRGALFLPKVLLQIVLLPVHGVIWVYDRYDLDAHYYATFYNAARTFGIHPDFDYATGFGLMFGARLDSTETFGQHEHLTMGGVYGGTYQVRANAWLDSGARLGPVKLTIGGNFDRFARLPFYGIGNSSSKVATPAMPINPLTDDTAALGRYRYQELRAALIADWRVLDDVHLVAQGAVTQLRFSNSTTSPAIDDVFNPADLVGFQNGVSHLYGQLELRWDRRRIAHPLWETTPYTTGWLVSGFAGRVDGFDGGRDFEHYGVDLQEFIHFGLGPRMLWLRFWGEGVTGNLDDVPFSELPYLGGDFLRGYDFARFRDRVSALGTAQYIWDVQRSVDAFVFVDTGRVYSSLDAVTLDGLHVGFGGGLQVHTATDFVFATALALSSDRGVFWTVTLTPYWDEVPRWR